MSNKKVLTFRDYLNAIMKLKKVADDLEDQVITEMKRNVVSLHFLAIPCNYL